MNSDKLLLFENWNGDIWFYKESSTVLKPKFYTDVPVANVVIGIFYTVYNGLNILKNGEIKFN